jgi:hypothetical protein
MTGNMEKERKGGRINMNGNWRERENGREYAVNLKTAVSYRGYIYPRKYGKTCKQILRCSSYKNKKEYSVNVKTT